MRPTAAEDRATRGRDPSADCGAKTEGRAAHGRPTFLLPPFGIGTKALNPLGRQPRVWETRQLHRRRRGVTNPR